MLGALAVLSLSRNPVLDIDNRSVPITVDPAFAPMIEGKVEARVACLSHHFEIPTPGVVLVNDIGGWYEPDDADTLGLWIEGPNLVVVSLEKGMDTLAEAVAHEMAHAADQRKDALGPHAKHDITFAGHFAQAIGYMAHCRDVGNDPTAPLTRQVFAPEDGMRMLPRPHGAFEFKLHAPAQRRIAL